MTDDSRMVGGRQPPGTPPSEGGGLPDICSALSSADKPIQKILAENFKFSIEDLRTIGIDGKWLEIARAVGVEKFIEIWAILDRENINQPKAMRDRMRVHVPAFSRCLKFVRNQIIDQATAKGHNANEIHNLLSSLDIEPVTVASVERLIRQVR
jgi:hypothetical protein